MRGLPVGYLQGVEELNSGPPKTNPSGGREEDLNPGPPDYKTSALPLGHPPPARLLGQFLARCPCSPQPNQDPERSKQERLKSWGRTGPPVEYGKELDFCEILCFFLFYFVRKKSTCVGDSLSLTEPSMGPPCWCTSKKHQHGGRKIV